tara:strand:- start:193 stop:366 length:174 start_codon:yes stop_codon:yes gene_type:complete
MGNNLCSGARNCEPSNGDQFGMLCRRPYERPLVVKFEKKDTYCKKSKKRKRNKGKKI